MTAEFFFKAYITSYRNHIFMEIVAIAKFAEIFETAFLEKHARVSSFSQPEKIWRYIFYGGHFMNCQ